MPTDMTVSKTILAQLGGNKFLAMTGANMLTGSDDALSGRIPQGLASNKANGFRVTLNSKDLYDIRFYRIRGLKLTELEGAEDIDVDNLVSVFSRLSGLRLKL